MDDDDDSPKLLKLPSDVGLTQNVLLTKEISICEKVNSSPIYNASVDNSLRLSLIQDVIIGPAIDSDGNIRGVVQLFSKNRGELDNVKDIAEF